MNGSLLPLKFDETSFADCLAYGKQGKKLYLQIMNELDIAINFSKQQLAFLNDCGFSLTEGHAPANYGKRTENYVLYYDSTDKLIEFALRTNGDNVECVIRKKINGKSAPYNDKENCLNAFQLMYLEDDLDYSSIKLFGFGLEQRLSVINTYAKLLLNNKSILCGGIWFNTYKISENYKREFFEKWKVELKVPEVGVPELLKQKTSFLLNEGYHVIEDSDLLPTYQRSGWHIIYGDGTNIIDIYNDSREPYYSLVINKKTVLDVRPFDYKTLYEMADHFVYILKEHI